MTQKPLHIFVHREAFFLAASSMFFGVFVSLAMQGILTQIENSVLLDRLILLISELAILLPPYLILKQRGVRLDQVLPLKPIVPLTLVMALVIVLGAIGLISIFEVVILPFFPIPDFLQQLESDLTQGSFFDTFLIIIAGTLVAPLVEEFIFRGILQQSLFYRFNSLIPAMVVPTVIFALFHVAYLFYLPALAELIMLALLLAWLMVKTGNLLIPILVHGVFNLSSFSGLFITDLEEINTLGELGWPWIIISILLTGAGWIYFRNMSIAVIDDVFLIPPIREEDLKDV